MVSEFQQVLLWGPSAEDLELVASCLNPAGFHTEAYSGELAVFEQSARRRTDVSAVVLVWSGEVREALAARLFVEGVPVAIVDHVYRSAAAEEMFSLGAALYVGKRQLALLPAALSRAIAQRRNMTGFVPVLSREDHRNDQFSLTVLHDLANILTGIQGKLKLLNEQAGTGLKHELDVLEQSCGSAVDLLRQSLMLAGPIDETERTSDATAILRQIGSLFRALLPPLVIFEEHLPPPGMLFQLGRPQIIQIALNLLVNARDAVLERAVGTAVRPQVADELRLGLGGAHAHGGASRADPARAVARLFRRRSAGFGPARPGRLG